MIIENQKLEISSEIIKIGIFIENTQRFSIPNSGVVFKLF